MAFGGDGGDDTDDDMARQGRGDAAPPCHDAQAQGATRGACPSSAAWVEEFVGRLDVPSREALLKSMRRVKTFSTSYSGVGFFESMVRQLFTGLGAPLPTCTYAGDILATCQDVLTKHDERCPCSPSCVFGNLLDRVPGDVLEKITQIQRRHLKETIAVAEKLPKRKRNAYLSEQCEALLDLLDAVLASTELSPVAHCYKHNRNCEVVEAGSTEEDDIGLHGAGTTCVEFSSRSSKRKMGAGVHTLSFAVWARCRQLVREGLILHECVPLHPSKRLLERYLQCSHVVFSFTVCPTLFGMPCTRRRRYAVAIRLDNFKAQIFREPAMLFACRAKARRMRSDIYFIATLQELTDILKKESTARRSFRAGQVATSFTELLSSGNRRRLNEYRQTTMAGLESYFELNQNSSYTGGRRSRVGCLLRTNMWWSHLHNRPLVGLERFYLMGNGPDVCATPHIFSSLSESCLAALSGNGMHVPSAGASLLSGLVAIC